jgi:acetyl-CoA C-acetyltransferase
VVTAPLSSQIADAAALLIASERAVSGAIALGHPLGATGARLMTTLVHGLRRTGSRIGLQTMCEGGGQANVTIIERLG